MTDKIHYLDWAATAIPSVYVSDYNKDCDWFNSNSYYAVNNHKKFSELEIRVKDVIGAKGGKVIFGGNASWFFERLYHIKNNYWLCGPYEHDCVNKYGLSCDFESFDNIYEEICCHQLVQNITGEIFDVAELGKKVKKYGNFFVCDATAAMGKTVVPMSIDEWCDCLVWSGHKIGVDNKQIGCAWISDKFFDYLMLSGTVVNGYGLVDGTPDLACAKALTIATKCACVNLDCCNDYYACLIVELYRQLEKNKIEYADVARDLNFVFSTNAFVLKGINADALCRYLATNKNVFVSPGHSACEKDGDYRVLKECGLAQEQCESTIRISFGPSTNEEDIKALVNGIVEFKEKFV